MVTPRQYVLLDANGILTYSCNSLFDTTVIESNKILDSFPLVDSIFSYLIQMPSCKNVLYEGVEINKNCLKGIFDFHFYVSSNTNRRLLNWIIEDHTSFYSKMRSLQQRRQEGILFKNQKKIELKRK